MNAGRAATLLKPHMLFMQGVWLCWKSYAYRRAFCPCRVSKKTLEINPNNAIIQARPALLNLCSKA